MDKGTLARCRFASSAPIGHGGNKNILHKKSAAHKSAHSSAHDRKRHVIQEVKKHEHKVIHKIKHSKKAPAPVPTPAPKAVIKVAPVALRVEAPIPLPVFRRTKTAGEFDDGLVIKYIIYALEYAPQWIREWHGKHPHPESESLGGVDEQFFGLQGAPPSVIAHFVAWQILKMNVRGDELGRYDWDYEASAAEHFMYIYFLAELTGDPYCYAAPTLYEAAKFKDELNDLIHGGDSELQKGQAQSGHPVLPANSHVAFWGEIGVSLGLEAYKSDKKGAAYAWGEAVEGLAGFRSPEGAHKIGEYSKDPLAYPYRN